MSELLDVEARDVWPFDVLDEGSVVRVIHFPSCRAEVGTLLYVEEDVDGRTLKRPTWKNIHEVQLSGTVRVLRGACDQLARRVT